jgi:hypothetical protein
VLIPYLDADGDPTDPTTPDTEISKDDGAAADCAEEVASPKNSVAMLTLTGAETDCSCLSLAGKAASGPKTTLATLYPRVLAEVGTGTLSAGSAGGGTLGTPLAYDVTGCYIKTTGGTGGGGTGGASNQARKIVTYNTSTGAFTVAPNWETTPSTDTTYAVLLPEGVTLGMLRALNPTTAGRTLDVTATGAAGIDWGNVENPTAAVNLSATNIDVDQVIATVTNQLTAAQIASGVWQDATAGDFTVASSIGKSLYAGNVAPGGSGGHLISGSNAGTTTLGALTVTGTLTVSDGIVVTRSTGNSSAITATGSGTGHGAILTSGTGATGNGLSAVAASTNGVGLQATGAGTGPGIFCVGGEPGGPGLAAYGGSEGPGAVVSGYGAGHGLWAAAGGTGDAVRIDGPFVAADAGNDVRGVTVSALAANVITAASMAADASAEIADAVWDEDATGHQTQGTFGQAIGDPGADADTIWALVNTNLNATVSSRASQTSVDTIDDFLDTEVAAIKGVTDKLDTALELDGAVYRYTVNALEQAPAGGGGGSTDWTADERTALRTILGIPASGTTPEVPSAGALKVIDDFLDTEMAAVLAAVDTEVGTLAAELARVPKSDGTVTFNATAAAQIQSEAADALAAYDPPTKAELDAADDATLAAIAALGVPTAAANAAAVWAAAGRTLTAFAFTVDTSANATETAIKAKTDNLPASPAAVGSAMTLADGAITDAKVTLPAEATGTPSTALQLLMWIAGMLGWRRVRKDSGAGTIVQYMANGSTVKTTSDYTSSGGVDDLGKAG